MGMIVVVVLISVGLSGELGILGVIMMVVVVGGVMFGDNLFFIFDMIIVLVWM